MMDRRAGARQTGRMRSLRRIAAAGTLALGLAVAGGACTGLLPGAGDDPLSRALAVTPAGQGAETEMYVSDIAAARALGAFEDADSPFAALGTGGLGPFRQYALAAPEQIPSPEAEEAIAVSIGRPPSASFRFSGMDPEALDRLFAHHDAGREDVGEGELLVRRGPGELDIADPLGTPASLGYYNAVWYTDDVLAGSPDEAITRAWGDPETTLAEAGTYEELAGCLGEDVVGAYLSHEGASIDPLPGGVTGLATATSGTSAEDWQDVLCLELPDEASAQGLADVVEANVSGGADPITARPWSEILGDADVEVIGSQVRVTSQARGGIFLTVISQQALPGLLAAQP